MGVGLRDSESGCQAEIYGLRCGEEQKHFNIGQSEFGGQLRMASQQDRFQQMGADGCLVWIQYVTEPDGRALVRDRSGITLVAVLDIGIAEDALIPDDADLVTWYPLQQAEPKDDRNGEVELEVVG